MLVTFLTGYTNAKHQESIEAFGLFCGADMIKYEDRGSYEIYKITKNGNEFVIKAQSNWVDGAFLTFEGEFNG